MSEEGSTEWMAQGNCAAVGSSVMFGPDVDAARRVCEGCPVSEQCLSYALYHEPDIGVWARLTFEERAALCPVCGEDKARVEDLACCESHRVRRIAQLIKQESAGAVDVKVSKRVEITAKTSAECPVPRGLNHSSAAAYSGWETRGANDERLQLSGCRCEASRQAQMTKRRERRQTKRREALDRAEYRAA